MTVSLCCRSLSDKFGHSLKNPVGSQPYVCWCLIHTCRRSTFGGCQTLSSGYSTVSTVSSAGMASRSQGVHQCCLCAPFPAGRPFAAAAALALAVKQDPHVAVIMCSHSDGMRIMHAYHVCMHEPRQTLCVPFRSQHDDPDAVSTG